MLSYSLNLEGLSSKKIRIVNPKAGTSNDRTKSASEATSSLIANHDRKIATIATAFSSYAVFNIWSINYFIYHVAR